jgi:CRISPR-associated protein Cas5 subtype I-A
VALTAICAKINVPIFSIKHPEAFQIGAALPVPQPSTLVGALAYCLGVHRGTGTKSLEEAKKAVVIARAKLLKGCTVVTPVILRRFRVLDRGLEAKKKGEVAAFEKACNALRAGDFYSFKRTIEAELTDALYREYLSHASIKCTWVLREPYESKLLYLLQRLGDTESLVTVIEAWSTDCREAETDQIDTEYPFTLASEVLERINGDYTMLKMCDESRKLKMYYIPCKKEVSSTPSGIKYFIYVTTKVEIKLKRPHRFFVIDGEKVIGGQAS